MPSQLAARRALAAVLASLAFLPAAAHARLDARQAAASDPEYGAAYRESVGSGPASMARVDQDALRAAAHDPEYSAAYRAQSDEARALSGAEVAASSAGAASDPENVAAYGR